jgi:glycosyltransferase involved in cell wall biosynthesis
VIELSKKWTVIWVEPAIMSEKIDFTPQKITEYIYSLTIPVIPFNAKQKWVRYLARVLSHFFLFRTLITFCQLRLVKKTLSDLKLVNQQMGVIIHNFHVINLIKKLSPSFILYDYIDNAFGFTSLPNHIKHDWLTTLQLADVVTVTSPGLANQIKDACSKNAVYVGNGVEYDFFALNNEPRPDDLPSGKPIVVYVGAVYPWLDYGLLNEVVRDLPEINFVFIGPLHPEVTTKFDALKGYGNVYSLGFKPYKMLPQYLHHVDVGIIPFQKNELTETVNPVKLYEYSAAGIPTIATDFSDDIRSFSDIVTIVSSAEEFAASIKKLLIHAHDQERKERLQEFARQHNWKNKSDQIIDLIQKNILSS